MTSKPIWVLYPSSYYNVVLRLKVHFFFFLLLKLSERPKFSWLEFPQVCVGPNSLLSIREQSLLLPSVPLGIMQSPVVPHEPCPAEPGEHCSTGTTWQSSSTDRRAAKALVNILLMDHDPLAAPQEHMVFHTLLYKSFLVSSNQC